MDHRSLGKLLESIYAAYHRREYVSPDPLQFLYLYPQGADRELVAFLASALAYGRVGQILKSLERVLALLGSRPWERVCSSSPRDLSELFSGFKHRFTDGSEVARHLTALVRWCDGRSLGERLKKLGSDDPLVCHQAFVEALTDRPSTLVSSPRRGSCCKRGMLLWRWMVRQDEIDPGGWDFIDPAKLILPLDTHLFSFARLTGLTSRRAPDLKTAREVTAAFAVQAPRDPVKYDFSVTRFGIHPDLTLDELRGRVAALKSNLKKEVRE